MVDVVDEELQMLVSLGHECWRRVAAVIGDEDYTSAELRSDTITAAYVQAGFFGFQDYFSLPVIAICAGDR